MSDSCKCGYTSLRIDGSQVGIEIDTSERHHTRERCDLEVTHSAECWQWHNGCAVARIEAVREITPYTDSDFATSRSSKRWMRGWNDCLETINNALDGEQP